MSIRPRGVFTLRELSRYWGGVPMLDEPRIERPGGEPLLQPPRPATDAVRWADARPLPATRAKPRRGVNSRGPRHGRDSGVATPLRDSPLLLIHGERGSFAGVLDYGAP